MEVIFNIIEIAYMVVFLVVLVRLTNLLSQPEHKASPVETVKKILPKKKRRPTAEEKDRKRDFERSMALMRNVDAYDGTPIGQEEIR